MKSLPAIMFITAALLAMSAGIWLGKTSDDNVSLKPARIQGAIYPQAKVLNDFELINHLSENVNKSLFKNQWSLIFVGYTQCPDICPTTLSVMNQAYEQMHKNHLTSPQIIFFSVDPQRDTPDMLKQYVEYFNKNFIGITGSLDDINKLSAQLNAVFRKAPGSNGEITDTDYLIDHSSALMLINPLGELQSILTAPHMPGTIIESIINSQAYFEAINHNS